MQDIYKTFEFNKIQEKLLEYSKTELGKVYINELVMLDDASKVKDSLSFLSEVSSLLIRYGPLPISSSANAIKLIEIAKKTALLTPRDLYLLSDDIETIVLHDFANIPLIAVSIIIRASAGFICRYFGDIGSDHELFVAL